MKKNIKYTNSQAYAALGVGFVCLVIGVPLWWKTTQIYRVQLPYADIEALSQKSLIVTVGVELVSLDEALTSSDFASLSQRLQSEGAESEFVTIKYKVTSRHGLSDELSAYKASDTLSALDRRLSSVLRPVDDHNKYRIVFLPPDTRVKGDYPYVGAYRNAFVKFSNVKDSSTQARLLLHKVLVQESSLRKKHMSVDAVKIHKPDKDSMRSVKSSLGYDVTFSLIVNEPHIFDVQWNIRQHIKDYLQPFVDKLPVQINVKSQVLSYTSLFLRSQRANNASLYQLSDLPHMINPLEYKLGSHVSNYPGLEFIVYIPTRSQSPLYIHNEQDEPVPSNSFLSPQWGGILIYNIPDPPAGTSLPYTVNIKGETIMQVFLTQLRLLLGAQSQVVSGVNVAEVSNDGIHDWEHDAFLRSWCVENVVTATLTLQSLARLLAQIGNIVINDDIGHEVHRAVDNIHHTYESLKRGSLMGAFTFSERAINASEKAFFDPSLLELLYFPEDQKFAIYIPLFLPISIPVLMSIVQAFKWIKAGLTGSTTHAKTD